MENVRNQAPEPGDGDALSYLPVFVKLEGRHCTVIGTTSLAEDKAAHLRRAGAQVNRIPSFAPHLVNDATLIVADVDEIEGRAIREFGDSRQILVNIVDKTELCSFIFPAIVQKGALVAAISTSGHSPALASWLRRRLQSQWGDEYGELVEGLRRTRAIVKQRIPGYAGRKLFYRQILEGGMLDHARAGSAAVAALVLTALEEFAHE
jgi:uroporphyrin-III C-methyltransferase/precorrin-2 dehydrogenase/sirohydrochlorin ferrochelatase